MVFEESLCLFVCSATQEEYLHVELMNQMATRVWL